MATVQDVLDYARLEVNDATTARYSDTEGLKHANVAMAKALELRPDLRMGTGTGSVSGGYGWGAFVELATTSSFPLPFEYVEKIGNFVVASWQSKDDQFVNDGSVKQDKDDYYRGLLGI